MMEVEFPQKLRPLFRPARYKIVFGGRGGGKSWGVARTLLEIGAQREMRILCARETQESISESVHHLLEKQISELDLGHVYTVQEKRIVGVNGTEFIFGGLRRDPEAMKSLEDADILWVEEANKVTEKSWDVAIPTIRKPGSEIWMTFNPESIDDETWKRFVVNPQPDSILIRLNWYDNPWFPVTLLSERNEMLRRNPDKERVIWGGIPRSGALGALWTRAMIDDARTHWDDVHRNWSRIVRIVVALDPAVTANENSDETGLVVVALLQSRHALVLEDASGKYTANEWAARAVQLYRKWRADLIVAEKNQGGDLVESVIRNVDALVPFKGIHAKRGKHLRAEPVSMLYEQGRIHHADAFTALEDQMCNWTPESSDDSPDRLDALVYGITELLVDNSPMVQAQQFMQPPHDW